MQTLRSRLSVPLHGPSKPPLALCRQHAHNVHTHCTLFAHLKHTLRTWPKYAKCHCSGNRPYANVCRVEGDDMLKWACNHAYRPRKLRFANSRGMVRAVCGKYVPEGVIGYNFHEPLDGKQNVMFYCRKILPCIRRILSRQKYAGNFYTKFRLVRDGDGYRIFGAFNTSDYYQFAYVTAQTKRIGGPGGLGDHVVPVPAFLSTDITVARKKVSFYPCFLGNGVLGDKHLSEPSSWLLVGCLPTYNDGAAKAAKRPTEGPLSIMRRKVPLLCTCSHLLVQVSVHQVCTMFAKCLHCFCIMSAKCLHPRNMVCIVSAKCLQHVCIMSA
jgi:hypothetical protein